MRHFARSIATGCGFAVGLVQAQASTQTADQPPNPAVTFEGKLMRSNMPASGVHSFVFSITDAGGTELWNSGTQNLTVTAGIYGIILGSRGMPALPQDLVLQKGLKLRVNADGVDLTPDILLVPSLQANAAWELIGSFAGDVSGTQKAMSVDALRGRPLDPAMSPVAGEVLLYNGSQWTASSVSGIAGPAGPTGPTGAQGVAGAQGAAGVAGARGDAGRDGNGVLSGVRDPQATVGKEGDFL